MTKSPEDFIAAIDAAVTMPASKERNEYLTNLYHRIVTKKRKTRFELAELLMLSNLFGIELQE